MARSRRAHPRPAPPERRGRRARPGRPARPARIPAVLVSDRTLSVDDAIAAARDHGWGGVVVFLGTVRDNSRGKRVTHLEYEAYPEMAEEKMREIATNLEAKYAPCRLVLHHRVG